MKIIIIPLLLISLFLNAQYDDLGNYQNLTSLTIVNPAFSGMEASVSSIINLNHHNSSQLVHVNLRRSENGISLYHYNNDYRLSSRTFDNNSTSIQYAYSFTFSRKLKIRLGTGVAQKTFYDYSSWSNTSEKKRALSIKTGLLINRNNFYFGVSVLNIPLKKYEFSFFDRNILTLQTGVKLNYKKYNFTPSILFFKYKLGYSSFYNLKFKRNGLVLNFGYKMSGAILGCGFESDKLTINYAYSNSFSKLSTIHGNTHSIMLAYKWNKKPSPVFRTITTPSF